MSTTIQRPRIATVRGLEQRTYAADLQATGALEFKVEGYASTFDPYDMGFYTETIKRGAFTQTLAGGPDVQLLINHEGLPIARTTNGSLRLSQDDRGLHFAAQLDRADPDAVTLMCKIGSGLMDECSFAFRVTEQKWNATNTERTITAVDLNRGDVSIVNFGANSATSVDARSRRRRTPNLATYQARARALALRDRDLRIRSEAGRR